jgi:hypothetical protein
MAEAGDRRPLKVPLLHSPSAISEGSALRVGRLQMEAEGHPSSLKKPHRETRGADTKSQTRTLARNMTFAGRSETVPPVSTPPASPAWRREFSVRTEKQRGNSEGRIPWTKG